jgi:hypothetical protein
MVQEARLASYQCLRAGPVIPLLLGQPAPILVFRKWTMKLMTRRYRYLLFDTAALLRSGRSPQGVIKGLTDAEVIHAAEERAITVRDRRVEEVRVDLQRWLELVTSAGKDASRRVSVDEWVNAILHADTSEGGYWRTKSSLVVLLLSLMKYVSHALTDHYTQI